MICKKFRNLFFIMGVFVCLFMLTGCDDTNDPPKLNTPTLISPKDKSTIQDDFPTFKWKTDGANSLQYELQVATDNKFLSLKKNVSIVNKFEYTPPEHDPIWDNGRYWWQVRAKDGEGNASDWTQAWEFTIDPNCSNIPDSPYISVTNANCQITISWNSVSGATSYNLYWSNSSGVSKSDNPIPNVTSPFKHEGLADGTYYYIVTACNSCGESNISNEKYSEIPPIPNSPSSNIRVEETSISANTRQAKISWDNVPGAISYNIYWSNSSGVSKSDNPILNVSSPFIHNNLSCTTYYYVITAYNDCGESDIKVSNEKSITIIYDCDGCNIPSQPYISNINIIRDQVCQITISWNNVSGATSYNLYWSNSPSVDKFDNKISNASSPYEHEVLADGTYYYVVTASNDCGESDISNEKSGNCSCDIPEPPILNSVIETGDCQITISWNNVSGATSYNLYWSNSSSVDEFDNKISNASSPYEHEVLADGTYYYVVTAYNDCGESNISSEKFILIDCNTPSPDSDKWDNLKWGIGNWGD